VIRELHVDPKIFLPQGPHDLLQGVAVFAAYAHQITLNGSLNLLLAALDFLYDLTRLLGRNALLHRYLLANRAGGGRFDDSVSQRLQRHAALDQLGLQNVVDGLDFVIVSRGERNGLLAIELNIAP